MASVATRPTPKPTHQRCYTNRWDTAYLKLTRVADAETFSARLDVFQTRDSGPPLAGTRFNPDPLYAEDGWSALAAWKHSFAPGRDVLVEALWVDWRRDDLAMFG